MSKAMFTVKLLLLSCLLAASLLAWSSKTLSLLAPVPAHPALSTWSVTLQQDMEGISHPAYLGSVADGLAGDRCCTNSACSPMGCCAVAGVCAQGMECAVASPHPVAIQVSVTQIFLSFDTRPPIPSA